MRRIISAGAVIFRRVQLGEVLFLLLYHGKNYWNFPKGKLEQGERAMTAFLREVEEETGIKGHELKVIPGFRMTDRYLLFGGRPGEKDKGRAFKIVIYYLVETRKREIAVSHEHAGFGWFRYPEALRISKYQNTKNILKKAHEFIQSNLPRTTTASHKGARRR